MCSLGQHNRPARESCPSFLDLCSQQFNSTMTEKHGGSMALSYVLSIFNSMLPSCAFLERRPVQLQEQIVSPSPFGHFELESLRGRGGTTLESDLDQLNAPFLFFYFLLFLWKRPPGRLTSGSCPPSAPHAFSRARGPALPSGWRRAPELRGPGRARGRPPAPLSRPPRLSRSAAS